MTSKIHKHGLTIDAQAIGDGIYAMICEKGEDAIVAFGMIPKWAIDLVRPALRDKVIAEAAKMIQATPDDLKPYVDEEKVNKIVSDIESDICTAIYTSAANKGRMIV